MSHAAVEPRNIIDAPATTILVLLGSLRTGSVNRQLAELVAESLPKDTEARMFDRLGELPFYNEDLDVDEPTADSFAAVAQLRHAVHTADVILVITPEYNGSIPGVLKNAVDWLSRPYGNGAVIGKPTAVIGASQGEYGGSWAHDEARKVLGIAGASVIETVRMSVPIASLDGGHPRQHLAVSDQLRDAIAQLLGRASS